MRSNFFNCKGHDRKYLSRSSYDLLLSIGVKERFYRDAWNASAD